MSVCLPVCLSIYLSIYLVEPEQDVFEQIELCLQADYEPHWGIETHKSLRRTNNPLR